MRTRFIALSAILTLAAAASASAAVDPIPADPTPAEREATRLAETKFEPIEKLAPTHRNLRRVSFADIYNENGQPGVTIEKLPTGEVHMTVVSNQGKVVDGAVLKPEAWALITSKDAVGLAPRKNIKISDEICVGASVVVEAVVDGKVIRREGEMCNGAADTHTMEYARLIADVAQKSIPRCAGHVLNTREASWTLRDCLRRSLVAFYKLSPFNNASANNDEAFASYAVNTWSKVSESDLASLQKSYGE